MHEIAAGLDRGLLPFLGPAQLGAGHPEEEYRVPEDAVCPLCGRPMQAHRVERSRNPGTPTYLSCPTDGR